MTAASTTKSAQHLSEKLSLGLPVATGETTLPVKTFLNYASVTSGNPTDTADGGASTSMIVQASFTCTGVALGDIVVGVGVVSGLAANSFVAGAYVSATDTVIVNLYSTHAAVTTTALVANILVADVT